MRIFLTISLLCLMRPLWAADWSVEPVTFSSHGVTLSGSIVWPVKEEPQAAVVFVHGSGKQARSLALGQRFAAEGIAALVYDKRGAGASGGVYEGQQSVSEANIRLLADDALAAFRRLKAHPRAQQLPLGVTGISQAGWIVPLVAEQEPAVQFIALWSSPVCRVSEEDIFSQYTRDRDHAAIASYQEALAARRTPYRWPDFLGEDMNPADSLATLAIPGLWVFGARDGSVPVDLSMQRLDALIAAGRPYEYVTFSSAGHNNMAATFDTVGAWIRRQRQPHGLQGP
ncbi:MAG: alpha/beta hydrolase [Xanthomonadales bacterium]|nr:alpha/beta hydrolase [Xanthomonadales bacterium]